MRIQRHHRPARGVRPAHDEVGDGLQARSPHLGLGHGVLLGGQTHRGQQAGREQRVRGVVARWRVGGALHQGLQKANLVVEVRVNPGIQRGVVHFCSAANCSSSCSKARTHSSVSSAVMDSSGLWLMPEFMPRMNSIACGIT